MLAYPPIFSSFSTTVNVSDSEIKYGIFRTCELSSIVINNFLRPFMTINWVSLLYSLVMLWCLLFIVLFCSGCLFLFSHLFILSQLNPTVSKVVPTGVTGVSRPLTQAQLHYLKKEAHARLALQQQQGKVVATDQTIKRVQVSINHVKFLGIFIWNNQIHILHKVYHDQLTPAKFWFEILG